MKIPRLPEIDLARFAAIATPETLKQLEATLRAFNGRGGGMWSYGPNRQSVSDILAARTPLLGDAPSVSWDRISRQITAACTKGDDQITANVEVAQILYECSREFGWSSVNVKMERLPLGMGGGVRYWSDIVVGSADGLFIPFFDHRREYGVGHPPARRIVHSMQNVGVRERNPDLMDARLAVVRFPVAQGKRHLTIDFHKEEELLSYEDLNGRVQLVYETWARVSEDRAGEVRRTGTGGPNPFGF